MNKKSVEIMIIIGKTLLSIVILIVGLIGSNMLLQLIPGNPDWALLAAPIGLSLSACVMFMLFERKSRWPIGWWDHKWAGRMLSGGTVAAVIVSTSTSIILLTGTVELGLNGWSGGVIMFQLLLFLSVAFAEEWLFRGYLYGIYRQAMGTTFAIIINSIIFTGIHLLNPQSVIRPTEHIVLEIVNIFLLSVLVSQARAFTGTLWLPISLHFMINFFQSTVFGFPNGGKEVESITWLHYGQLNIWNGAGYGLESSLLFTPIILLTIIVYSLYRRRTTVFIKSHTAE